MPLPMGAGEGGWFDYTNVVRMLMRPELKTLAVSDPHLEAA
ncbi:MAG TPA: hypothetical protein VNU68_28805 [Verrucomicrobiae bacterium]|jgi:hypothetical protein|nr:hypothetical protein [Verrucomicrobiae bacterium]